VIETRLRELVTSTTLFSELARIGRTQQELTDWLVQRGAGRHLLSAAGGASISRWQNLVAE
jgi:hypothetical protein